MRPRLVKLVRDGVGRFLGDSAVSYRPVPPEELPALLRAKLIEEAVEYLLDPSVGELADILDVLRALAQHDLGARWDDVVIEALAKSAERGDFREGVGMYVTTTAPPRHEGAHA